MTDAKKMALLACEALEDKNDFVFERCGSRVVL